MLFHGEKCRHCRSNMSAPKPITEGPRKGGYRTICVSCGHIEYHAGPAPGADPAPTAPAASKPAGTQAPVVGTGILLKPKPRTP